VEHGSALVTESGQTLDEIVRSVKKVSDLVAEIDAAGREQSSGIEQVNKAVMQMDRVTQENAALVEEITAASKSVAEQAQSLNEMMTRYQVREGAAEARVGGALQSRRAASAA
jgi:methyl-accepting chemotaxis protein